MAKCSNIYTTISTDLNWLYLHFRVCVISLSILSDVFLYSRVYDIQCLKQTPGLRTINSFLAICTPTNRPQILQIIVFQQQKCRNRQA